MAKNDRNWIPEETDLDWIESISAAARRGAGRDRERPPKPLGIPIVDRDAGRVLSALAAGRRRIVEVGTAYGYSTLWMALGQPADGTIVTIDPDRSRTDLARGWWREAGVADERITVVNAPALEAFAARRPALAGPFDLAFIDALKPEYEAYLEALVPRLAPGRPRGRRQRALEWPRLGCPAASPTTSRTRRRSGRSTPRSSPILASRRRSCRSATGSSSRRGVADGVGRRGETRPDRRRRREARRPRPRPPLRVQRELAGTREVQLDLPAGATSKPPGRRSSVGIPFSRRAGRRCASRATATTPSRRRRSRTATRSRSSRRCAAGTKTRAARGGPIGS